MAGQRFMLSVRDRSYFLDPRQEWVVGRAQDASIVIDDLLVSRRHAAFFIREDGVYVRDLGSRNGILINGQRATGETKLRHGDRVTIGANDFQIKDVSRENMKTWPSGPPDDDSEIVQSDAMTQSVSSVYQLLLQVCETAFVSKRLTDAQVAVGYLVSAVNEAFRLKKNEDFEVLEKATEYSIRLANMTLDPVWIDRILEMHLHASSVPQEETISSLSSLIPKMRQDSGYSIRRQVASFRQAALKQEDQERLEKLEALEGP